RHRDRASRTPNRSADHPHPGGRRTRYRLIVKRGSPPKFHDDPHILARIVRDVKDIRALKQQPGKDMHAVGGATLVSSLMNEDLIDELRLTVHPIVLGEGKALFKDVKERHALELVQAKSSTSGRVSLTYSTRPSERESN
ncbi:MAG: dihydrofolate reductase family protein, partial [Geminicoccales bacterium]